MKQKIFLDNKEITKEELQKYINANGGTMNCLLAIEYNNAFVKYTSIKK